MAITVMFHRPYYCCRITTLCLSCCRDYDSLSKENVFDNNKLVSVTFCYCHNMWLQSATEWIS